MKIKRLAATLAVIMLMAGSGQSQQPNPVQMKHMLVSNLSISAATISWVTDQKTSRNWVEVSSPDTTMVFEDEYKIESYAHTVSVISLKPDTEYKFRFGSDDQVWDNSGQMFSFRTFMSSSITLPRSMTGSLTDNWDKPVSRSLVNIRVRISGFPASMPKTVLTDQNGNWTTTWSDFRAEDGSLYGESSGDEALIEYIPNYWSYAADSLLVIFPPSGPASLGTTVIELVDPNATTPGDVNGNGAINIFDLLDLLKIISGKMIPLDSRQFTAADLDSSGKVNIFDLLVLLGMLSSHKA